VLPLNQMVFCFNVITQVIMTLRWYLSLDSLEHQQKKTFLMQQKYLIKKPLKILLQNKVFFDRSDNVNFAKKRNSAPTFSFRLYFVWWRCY
jgi:hypothetical protein